jgi:L-ascorbate metabolism protein UlaG (beta-lactamase superfamily)
MQYRHLGWAGVEFRAGAHRVLIDPLEHTEPLLGFLGAPRLPLTAAERLPHVTTHVLLTHTHPDHFDPDAIRKHVSDANGEVLVAESLADAVASHGLPVRPVRLGERHHIGPFVATPVPASDGFGDVQHSWIVSTDGWRCFHGGDTIWHGHWSRIARDHAPIDVAFLPINGFVGAPPGAPRVDVPGSLTPHQAVEAAFLLGARSIVPIHHGVFHNPPMYVEWPDALGALTEAAARRGIVIAGALGSA